MKENNKGEKIKLLIVDDIAQVRTDLRRLLYFEEDVEVVGEADNGQEAIEKVGELKPDIVLMDINMPVMDGIVATEQITRLYPDVSVVVVSIQGEQEYLRKAMVAGARDFLIKPVSSEDISSTLRQVYSMGKARHRNKKTDDYEETSENETKIISFFSGKGGVGKSVLAANLAAKLAQRGRDVVLVDLDLQFGDLSLLFNLSEFKSITDLVEDPDGINEHTVPRYLMGHRSGVQLLSSCFWPQDAEKITEERLDQIIRVLEDSFQYIIIDMPCALKDLTLYALEKSHQVFLVSACDMANIKASRTVLNVLKALDCLDKTRLVLNMEGSFNGVDRDDLKKSLGLDIYYSIPRDEKNVTLSVNKGIPLVLSRLTTEAGTSLCGFSEKVVPLEEGETVTTRQDKRGFRKHFDSVVTTFGR